MKKPLIYLISIILFIGCNSQKSISVDKPENLKKNQLIGTFVAVSRKITRGKEDRINEYYFRIENKNYFVKFSEGYVSKEKMLKYLNKQIVIKGEIKNGKWEEATAGSFIGSKVSKRARSGDYIIIIKIFK